MCCGRVLVSVSGTGDREELRSSRVGELEVLFPSGGDEGDEFGWSLLSMRSLSSSLSCSSRKVASSCCQSMILLDERIIESA